MFEKIITDFIFLFATIDPIGTVAIFAGLTSRYKKLQRRHIAMMAIFYAGSVLLGSMLLGQLILTHMGIRMISLQVAGGVILFIFALKMIFSDFHEPEGKEVTSENDHSIAVFPLAIPVISSPGAIMASILITDNNKFTFWEQCAAALSLLAILALTYLMMLLSDRILKITGKNGAAIMVKVIGMLLAALSVELIMEAIGIERWLVPVEH
jgi:multiple antibiotic resistance protein